MMYPYMTLADETENGGTQRRFKDRFHMTFEQNLFLAKKKRDENVYCGMRMENRAVTFPGIFATGTIIYEIICWIAIRV